MIRLSAWVIGLAVTAVAAAQAQPVPVPPQALAASKAVTASAISGPTRFLSNNPIEIVLAYYCYFFPSEVFAQSHCKRRRSSAVFESFFCKENFPVPKNKRMRALLRNMEQDA